MPLREKFTLVFTSKGKIKFENNNLTKVRTANGTRNRFLEVKADPNIPKM